MPQIYNKELLDSYREPTKAHKTYQGVPNMSYAFTGRYLFSFSGLYGKLLVYVAKLIK